MVVTSQAKGRARPNARAGTMKRKNTVKPRNAPAAALADPRYRSRMVKGVKVYSRKGKALPAEDEDA